MYPLGPQQQERNHLSQLKRKGDNVPSYLIISLEEGPYRGRGSFQTWNKTSQQAAYKISSSKKGHNGPSLTPPFARANEILAKGEIEAEEPRFVTKCYCLVTQFEDRTSALDIDESSPVGNLVRSLGILFELGLPITLTTPLSPSTTIKIRSPTLTPLSPTIQHRCGYIREILASLEEECYHSENLRCSSKGVMLT